MLHIFIVKLIPQRDIWAKDLYPNQIVHRHAALSQNRGKPLEKFVEKLLEEEEKTKS